MRCTKGTPCLFKELYTRHTESMLRLAVVQLGLEQDAEDCVQEVFCNFWQQIVSTGSLLFRVYQPGSLPHYSC